MVILGHGIFFSQKVSNLCVFRLMDCPINHLCKIIYLELHRISKIRPFISVEAAKYSLLPLCCRGFTIVINYWQAYLTKTQETPANSK